MKDKFIIFIGGKFKSDILRIEQVLPKYVAKKNIVYCFEYPQFTKIFSLLSLRFPLIEQVTPQLIVYHSFGILPFGRSIPIINKINHLFNYILFKILVTSNFKNAIIISFTPEITYVNKLLKNAKKVIYYCIDEYTSLPFWSSKLQKRQFAILEKSFLKKVNIVIAVSSRLMTKYKKLHHNIRYFPTPADLSIYKCRNNKIPADLKALKRPIIGFIGALYDWRIDMDLIYKALKKIPQAQFVFIGTINIKKKHYTRLKQKPNFHYLGYKKYDEVPFYVNSFDVCIIPYNTNSYGKHAYPVKLNEYLYYKKPVVTTALPSIQDLGEKKLIFWAKNDDKFIHYLKTALDEKEVKKLIKNKKDYAINHSWNRKADELLSIIHD